MCITKGRCTKISVIKLYTEFLLTRHSRCQPWLGDLLWIALNSNKVVECSVDP